MSEVFLKVVNMGISAGWLVLAVLALRFLLKKAPKWVNVLLWGIVALRLICPFSIESTLSLIPSKETISPEIMMDWTPEISTGMESLDQVVNPVISTSFAPEPYASANPLQILIPVAANFWLLGVLVMLIYTVLSYFALRRKLRTAVLLQKNIFQCESVQSPFVLGILRPRIFLPYTLDGMELHHVVAHEKAHICRKDHWWKPLGFLLLSIYWFHPLMWVAYILLCRDIELACDEKVVAKLDAEQRANYTQALVSCSINRRRIAACPLAFGEVGVKDRVKSIMHYRKPAFWIVLMAVIVCVVVAVCFLTDPVQNTEDLSLLNYKHAISFSAQQDVIPAVHYSSEKDKGVIGICMVEGNLFSEYLDEAKWNEKWFTPSDLSSPGSVAVNVAENLRITVYDRNFAAVKFNEEVRYYRIANDDYEKILALLLPADEERLEKSSESRFELALGVAVVEKNDEIHDNLPSLTVTYGEESIDKARVGEVSWEYLKEDGSVSTILSDGAHPLDAKQSSPFLTLDPYADEPLEIWLQWDLMPDSVLVRYWGEESWGKLEEEPAGRILLKEKRASDNTYRFEPKEENCIYEVIATWKNAPDYNGKIYYNFHAVITDRELTMQELYKQYASRGDKGSHIYKDLDGDGVEELFIYRSGRTSEIVTISDGEVVTVMAANDLFLCEGGIIGRYSEGGGGCTMFYYKVDNHEAVLADVIMTTFPDDAWYRSTDPSLVVVIPQNMTRITKEEAQKVAKQYPIAEENIPSKPGCTTWLYGEEG